MRTVLVCLAVGCLFVAPQLSFGRADESGLPRFTEEREAAALFFVRKHLPELLPLLEELKKNNASRYELEIREVFQTTEYLADLKDDPRRHDLELKTWRAENRAHVLVGKLSTPNEDERKKIEATLLDLAKELIETDLAILELKAEQLDKELGELKDEIAKMRDGLDRYTREQYDRLLEKVRKPRGK
jgi:hypothetical protein